MGKSFNENQDILPIPDSGSVEPPVLRPASHQEPVSKSRPKRGVVRILAFFFIFSLLACGLEICITKGLRSIPTSKFGSFNKIVRGEVNADILISGSSRALCHYDPRVIQSATGSKAYNVGMNASQIDLQLAVLKTYLKHNKDPKLLIQNLDMFSFETTAHGALYDPGYFMPYLKEREIYNFVESVDNDAWKWKYIPLYGYAVSDLRFTWVQGLSGLIGLYGPEDYFLGYNPRTRNWTDEFEKFKSENEKGVTYPIMEKGVASLESILAICQSRGIEVVLVYSPEYIEMQALEQNRQEIISKFETMAQKYNVSFWDYSDAPISRSKQFFNNSQHLNADGAAAFSFDLANRIVATRFD